MKRELQTTELKNGFRVVKLGGSPLFIDTIGKSWPSDENNSDAQDCDT